MVGNYGLFPKFLAIGSSSVAVLAMLTGLATNFLGGLVVSVLVLMFLAAFLNLIAFLFEPQVISQFPEPKTRPSRRDSEAVDPDQPADVSSLVQVIKAPTAEARAKADRILQGANRSLVAQARVINQPSSVREAKQTFESQDAVERREDQEWAEMFRAL